MTVTQTNLVITITIVCNEAQASAIVPALSTAIQTALTAHGIGGTLTVAGEYSEAIT